MSSSCILTQGPIGNKAGPTLRPLSCQLILCFGFSAYFKTNFQLNLQNQLTHCKPGGVWTPDYTL